MSSGDHELPAMQANWAKLLAEVEQLEQELTLARASSGLQTSSRYRSACQDYFGKISEIVGLHSLAFYLHQEYLEPYPFSQLQVVARHLEELGYGLMPNDFAAAKSKGRPTTLRERRDIASAIFFLKAVERGDWLCPHPTALVAQCYGVTQQAVLKWLRRADEFTASVDPPHRNLVEEAMRNAGIRYTHYGRGAPDPTNQGSKKANSE